MSIDLYAPCSLPPCRRDRRCRRRLGGPRAVDAAVAGRARPSCSRRAEGAWLRLVAAVRRVPVPLVVGGRWSLARLERTRVPGRVNGRRGSRDVTTGSTGPAGRGAFARVLWAQHLALADHLRLTEADVDLPTLPVSCQQPGASRDEA